MVRKAALQAIGLVVESDAQAGQQGSAGRIWPSVYIKLAETLCSLLTVAPDSPLASQEVQQASHLATAWASQTASGESSNHCIDWFHRLQQGRHLPLH